MTTIHLPSQLRDLVGGKHELAVSGNNLKGVIDDLERRYPMLAGRVRDEQGALRRHVKIFRNGEPADLDDAVTDGDEIRILPAISGGSAETELLVGTRKGLVVLRGPRGDTMDIAGRAFEGHTVEYAIRNPRSGTYLASVTDSHFGPRVFLAEEPLGRWEQSDGPIFPEEAGAAVERIWTIEMGSEEGVVWAGVAPAALFRSEDGGRTWKLNRGLWDRPERPQWQPGGGGLCLHSICPWPDDPQRLAIAISAAGVWLTEDGGDSWRPGFGGLVARYLPEDAREGAAALCVHDIKRVPGKPERIYLQFHGGVYRSDDTEESWNEIGGGLPSDFGFPLVIDPTDPDRAFVIPMTADVDRVTVDGRVQVFETTDAGESWTPRGDGLPQQDAFLTVLRQAFCGDDRGGSNLGLYFGATSGDVFGSADGGATWITAARHLPPVLSVRCSR